MSLFGSEQYEANEIAQLVEECIKKNGAEKGIELVMDAVEYGMKYILDIKKENNP